MSGCAVSILDEDGIPLPFGQLRNVNVQKKVSFQLDGGG